jgi:hypothetical protein
MAPPKQLEQYGRETGFGWKMGEIVAAQVVYVPVLSAEKTEHTEGLYILGGLLGLMAVAGVVGVLWLRKA